MRRVALVLAVLVVIYVFVWPSFRATFFRYIDAKVRPTEAAGVVLFGRYLATVQVNLGHEADVACNVEALTGDDEVAAEDDFTLTNADGLYEHTGTLDVLIETEVREDDFIIECHELK